MLIISDEFRYLFRSHLSVSRLRLIPLSLKILIKLPRSLFILLLLLFISNPFIFLRREIALFQNRRVLGTFEFTILHESLEGGTSRMVQRRLRLSELLVLRLIGLLELVEQKLVAGHHDPHIAGVHACILARGLCFCEGALGLKDHGVLAHV